MPRRVSLPGASELFRPTHSPEPVEPEPVEPGTVELGTAGARTPDAGPSSSASPGRGTGRVRHDEKITVYVSRDELLALEQARLTLRAEHGMAVDRGRIVREAVSALIADLQQNGPSSELVRRLSQTA